jgi:hypothetical protein
MAKRREPGQREYNPLDDARGRLPIDIDLVRDVISAPAAATARAVTPLVEISSPLPAKKPAFDPEPTVKSISVERLTKYNKFLTTPTEKLELDRLAARISGALGVSVRSSHLIRACLIHLLHAETAIIELAGKQQPIKRPSNAESVALAEFDQIIAELLSQAFRHAVPLTGGKITE